MAARLRVLSRPGSKLFNLEHRRHFHVAYRCLSGHENKQIDNSFLKAIDEGATQWWDYFNKLTGLTEVKRAQNVVLEAEMVFQNTQEQRREEGRKLTKLQTHLHQVTKERELAQRGTELYLQLVTQENKIIKDENEMKEQIRVLEEEERRMFSKMSSALRASQEVERSQARQSQQFSLILSVAGVLLGGLISMYLNRNRMKKMESIVSMSSETVADYQDATSNLRDHVQKQEEKLSKLIALHHAMYGDKIKSSDEHSHTPEIHDQKLLHQRHDNLEQCTKEILQVVQNQESVLDKEIADMKALLGANRAKELSDNVIYVGPEMKEMLADSQKQIETRIKLTALAGSVFVYGGLVLTLPILYVLLKGSGGS